jgi:Ca-activated chloride channel family protein
MRTAFIALGLAAGVFLTSSAQAQDAPPRFKSSTEVVTIQASVRTNRGRPVQGLTPEDFEIRDNGQVRQILSMRADLQSPISVAVLVDTSGSMATGPKMALARQALDSLLSQLHRGADEVAVFTFDSRLHERRGFSFDPEQMRGALDKFDVFGSTSLYDATAAAARRLSERSAAHKAIIVLTDGIDTSSSLTAPEVSGLASSIAVPVYIFATVPSIDQRAMLESTARSVSANAADLRDLAEWTGGQLVFASNDLEVTTNATKLVHELRQQYIIAIEAAAGPEWRRLDVRVKRPAAVVKARSGYFGG